MFLDLFNCISNIIKYPEDNVVIAKVSDEDTPSEHRTQVNHTLEWSSQHQLILNASKSNELVIRSKHCNIKQYEPKIEL